MPCLDESFAVSDSGLRIDGQSPQSGMAGPPQFQPRHAPDWGTIPDITAVKASAEGQRYSGSGRKLMQFRVSPKSLQDNVSAEQWQARVGLAVAHRLGFHPGLFRSSVKHP